MATLAERGQDAGVQWDAYRDDDGWVVALRWQAGRSENSAHWEIHSAQRSTTLHPKDDAARELIDPSRRTTAHHRPDNPTHGRRRAAGSHDAARATAESCSRNRAAAIGGRPTDGDEQQGGADGGAPGIRPAPGGHWPTGSIRNTWSSRPCSTIAPVCQPPAPAKTEAARTGTDHSSGRGHRKGQRPVMPGWEDVLLGGGQTPNLSPSAFRHESSRSTGSQELSSAVASACKPPRQP